MQKKWISGYEGRYEITDTGEVISHTKKCNPPRYLRPRISTGGYRHVLLSKDMRYSGLIYKEIGALFSVTPVTIYHIIKGKTWTSR